MSFSDDEDAQVQTTLALSLVPDQSSPSAEGKQKRPQNTTHDRHEDESQQPVKLDLKELAAARRSRPNNKRKLDRDVVELLKNGEVSKRQKSEVIDLSDSGDKSNAKEPTQNSETSFLPGSFPKGVIKRTWAYGYDRSGDVKIEELIQKNLVTGMVISTFQLDLEWLFSKLQVGTKMIMAMGLKDKKDQERWKADAAENCPNIKLCFPDMSGQISSMHCKFMILFYGTHVRISIPTANFMKYDWGETGKMENSVFIIDLPRLEGGPNIEEGLTPFGHNFFHLLKKMGMDSSVCGSLLRYDFTETARFGFVHTIAGSHTDENTRKTGFLGLSHAVKGLKLQSSNKLTLDYAAASLGSLNDQTLDHLYRSAMGEDIAAKDKSSISSKHLRTNIRILFPSEDTVKSIEAGPESAGTVTLQEQYWNSGKFPKDCMREYKSIRTGLLSHNKLILARGEKDGTNVAWVYIGSANLSESAWGKLVTDRAKKVPKLNCRNWECGVVFPMAQSAMEGVGTETGETVPAEVFESHFTLPFQYPGEEYYSGRSPWFFKKYHP